jgi:hypothetical protein
MIGTKSSAKKMVRGLFCVIAALLLSVFVVLDCYCEDVTNFQDEGQRVISGSTVTFSNMSGNTRSDQ